MKIFKTIISGFAAGVLIAIAGSVYFKVSDHVIGSFLFSFGLFFIVVYGFNLYTGKVGFMIEKKNYLEVLLTLIGNLFGTVLFGLLILQTKIGDSLYEVAKLKYVGLDIDFKTIISYFVLAFFCGCLMCSAYMAKKKLDNPLGQYLGLIFCVMVFILCGFEHSIANMFYITVAKAWGYKTIIILLLMILGNGCGGIGIWAIDHFLKEKDEVKNLVS